VLRRMFGLTLDLLVGGWKKLHNEELQLLFSFVYISRAIKSRRMKLPWYAARMGEKKSAVEVLVGKPEGRKPLGRYWCRWENIIKIDLKEMG
jgi:hypothetical protein